jgi:hypothetical protein
MKNYLVPIDVSLKPILTESRMLLTILSHRTARNQIQPRI